MNFYLFFKEWYKNLGCQGETVSFYFFPDVSSETSSSNFTNWTVSWLEHNSRGIANAFEDLKKLSKFSGTSEKIMQLLVCGFRSSKASCGKSDYHSILNKHLLVEDVLNNIEGLLVMTYISQYLRADIATRKKLQSHWFTPHWLGTLPILHKPLLKDVFEK